MPETTTANFLVLVSGKQGHFRLESGHHSRLWLDLDALFTNPAAVAPFVAALTDALRQHNVDVVCGPLLGGAFLAQLVAHALDVEFSYTERIVPEPGGELFQVQYRLPPALRSRMRGKRVAMVDDVMSAGSALRGTYAELLSHGAVPIVAGALLVFGSVGANFFAHEGVAVDAVLREPFDVWEPSVCPLCTADVPLEDITAALAPPTRA